MEHSSDNAQFGRTSSGSLPTPQRTLGDFLRDSKHEQEYNVLTGSGSSSHGTVHVKQGKPGGKQRKTKIQVLAVDRFETRKKAPLVVKGWSISEKPVQPQTNGNRIDVKIASIDESHSDGVANRLSSPRQLGFVSAKDFNSTAASRSLLQLVALTSCGRDSGSSLRGDQSSAPSSERFGQLQSGEYAPLSSRWREVQGAKNWNGLLDPLDLDLRREILRYGDFATLTYDNFESEARSKYAGRPRFRKHQMFTKLHKHDTGYQVTKYLYATCENPLPGALRFPECKDVESNWIGYVAVATEEKEIERLGRRDIVVAWRGTVRTIEWLIDAEIRMVPIMIAGGSKRHSMATTSKMQCPKVENGFWSLYTSKRLTSPKSASEQVITELTRLLTLYKGETLSITLTGHSLGGALAILTAYEIAARGLNNDRQCGGGDFQAISIPVTVFSFGSPHVGNRVFRRKFEEMNLKALRVVEAHDLVPKTMNSVYCLVPWVNSEPYKHVGVELQVDHTLSPYLRQTKDPVHCHNVECYLHLVDGHQGTVIDKSKGRFRFGLVTGRDYALVNKYADLLLGPYCIPPSWWQVENKGLELSAEGRWIEPPRAWENVRLSITAG